MPWRMGKSRPRRSNWWRRACCPLRSSPPRQQK
jgi:hypothetical protein